MVSTRAISQRTGRGRDGRIVVGDHHDRQVVEQREQHHHDRGDRIEIEDQNARRHEKQKPHGLSDAIDRVAVHALEDAAGLLDRRR